MKKYDKFGFIDHAGKEIVAPTFGKVGTFGDYSKDWMLVESNGLKGFIDADGNLIVPVKYAQVDKFDNIRKNWSLVKDSKDKLGFIDKTGKEVIPVVYDNIEAFVKKPTAVANVE